LFVRCVSASCGTEGPRQRIVDLGFRLNDPPLEGRSIGSIPKVDPTFESDALEFKDERVGLLIVALDRCKCRHVIGPQDGGGKI